MSTQGSTLHTEIDIRASADRIIVELQQGRNVEAFQLLDLERMHERPVVQEALDRYVAMGARDELDHLRGNGLGDGLPRLASTLDRLRQSTLPPRMPVYTSEHDVPNELAGLTSAQVHDVYASMVEVRGDQAAIAALANGESVILGLRRETYTPSSMDDPRTRDVDESLMRRGTGIYDDQIVVLRKDATGERHLFISGRATTEPSAQYDHHAGSDGSRPFSGQGEERRRIEPHAGYGEVVWRKIEGVDVNADSYRDLGRMAEGTIEMTLTRHGNPALAGTRLAFRPSPEQLDATRIQGLVQRDTNGDGYFTTADVNGVQDLNTTFKIHSGGLYNTDSAGCQTIYPLEYSGFIAAAQANPAQTRWQYVLTSTQGGLFHNVEVGRDAVQPALPPQPGERRPVEDADRPPRQREEYQQPHAGLFNDPILDRYLAAIASGDRDAADRAALAFAQSPEGRALAQRGDELLVAQLAQEPQQQMQATQSREAATLA